MIAELARRCLPALVLMIPAAAFAGDSFTDFEPAGFTPGESVDNHRPDGTEEAPPISFGNACVQAWFVPTATTDEEVVDLTATDPQHGKVWRLSQGASMGSLGQNPHSANTGDVAGETGAANDAGCGPPTTDTFYGEVQFRSATGSPQPGLAIAMSANSADQRHGFVRVVDDGAAFDLTFFETVDGCGFSGVNVDADLAYDEWHTLGIAVFFVDGLAAGSPGSAGAFGNDEVRIFLNGFQVATGTSWESCVGAESVDRLLFGASNGGMGTVIPGQLGGGLYFDDVLVTHQVTFTDLQVTKSDSADPALAGGPLEYTIAVDNLGSATASGVQVVDTLPAGSTNVSASGTGWSCAVAGTTVTCDLASLPPGPAAPITVSLDAPATPGVVPNEVSVGSDTLDTDAANNTASEDTTLENADLRVTKSDSADPVLLGQSFDYTVEVENLGPSTATAVEVVDTLPAGVTNVAASGAGWSCAVAGTTVTCDLATLPPGPASPIVISVDAPLVPGVITNEASVSSDTLDGDGTNDTASEPTTVGSPVLPPPVEIPTASSLGLAALAALLAWAALRRLAGR